ncbi:class II aaRS and biotin synthetase [Nadsonia fulvescens var. elongata DSM 6958]|uniref:Class II aaRS and biotin synthetase n=1 Tax=Nadsonia fulvescens var. elongata DSM 6958 TaxID=857566 RepID=A0A1E3PL45_9ASCO|nr:class II aaRS and biotin synthetase [Nadsonia fulvescens var. elongata DSM 6958]
MKRVSKITEHSSAEDVRYNQIIQDLLPYDSQRFDFVRACFNKLGLRVGPKAEMTIPHLTRMKLSSINVGDTDRLIASLKQFATQSSNKSFKLSCHSNDFVFHYDEDLETLETSSTSEMSSTDETQEDKKISLDVDVFHQGSDNIPDARSTPHFNHYLYYSTLQQLHSTNPATKFAAYPKFGAMVLYSEVITSTSTIMESNPVLLEELPAGFVVTGTIQNQGRGRGGNVWVNPVGVLAVSHVYRIPLNSDIPAFIPKGIDGFKQSSSFCAPGNYMYGTSSFAQPTSPIVFVQYIASLAMVEAIRDLSGKANAGYGNLPVMLKWPNDIYALDPNRMTADDINGDKSKINMSPADYLKIGGILVNCSSFRGDYYFVIGSGVNVANDQTPTTSLNLVVDRYNQLKPANAPVLDHYSMEELMATFMNKFEQISNDFNYQGFTPFEEQYYSRWLHSNQIVRVEQAANARCRIIGLSDDGGLQVQELDTPSKAKINLVPDGNSFDIFKGLLKRKI